MHLFGNLIQHSLINNQKLLIKFNYSLKNNDN